MNPTSKRDIKAFKSFAFQVRVLVGMLQQLGNQGWTQLRSCGSLAKSRETCEPHLRANFHRYVNPIITPVPTLLNLADWLKYEVRVQISGDQYNTPASRETRIPPKIHHLHNKSRRSTTILFGNESRQSQGRTQRNSTKNEVPPDKPRRYCPFCDTEQHYLNQCNNFKLLSVEQKTEWIKANRRCGREHQAAKCNLKAKCKQCEKKHLDVLHEVNTSQNAVATGKHRELEPSTL